MEEIMFVSQVPTTRPPLASLDEPGDIHRDHDTGYRGDDDVRDRGIINIDNGQTWHLSKILHSQIVRQIILRQ